MAVEIKVGVKSEQTEEEEDDAVAVELRVGARVKSDQDEVGVKLGVRDELADPDLLKIYNRRREQRQRCH